MLGYFGIQARVSYSNRLQWERRATAVLLNLHTSWVLDNKPQNYTVARYLSGGDTFVQVAVDTNLYSLGETNVEALFRCEYKWRGKPLAFVVSRDGALFRRGDSGKGVSP